MLVYNFHFESFSSSSRNMGPRIYRNYVLKLFYGLLHKFWILPQYYIYSLIPILLIIIKLSNSKLLVIMQINLNYL